MIPGQDLCLAEDTPMNHASYKGHFSTVLLAIYWFWLSLYYRLPYLRCYRYQVNRDLSTSMKYKYLFIILISIIPLLSACSSGGGSDDDSDDSNDANELERVSNTSCVAPDQPTTGNSDYGLEPVFPNLPTLGGLLGMFQAPGDSTQWFAMLREGRILSFTNSVAANSLNTVLDISTQVMTDGEMGLLGMAFHPDFASNGQLYVHYNSAPNAGASTISRFTFQGSLPISNSTEEVLISVAQPTAFHNGGSLNFGADGYLYFAFGDGDVGSTAQDGMSLLGAMSRIDVDTGSPYSVPADNPFVGNSSFLPEIFATGLRNPWRWTIDSLTGSIWLADVGDSTVEEVDLIQPGNNYGWPIMEGSQCVSPGCNTAPLTLPVVEHVRPASGFCSITGGHVWRSNRLPALLGSFVYGDFCSSTMWRLVPDGGGWRSEALVDNAGGAVSFAQGNDGEVYKLEMFGAAGESAFRIIETGGGGTVSTIPTNLSDSAVVRWSREITLIRDTGWHSNPG
jgi:glucose/arabinose dehydrogenase